MTVSYHDVFDYMRKLKFQPPVLQRLYLITCIVLFLVIIYIPTLISGPVHFSKKFFIEEETIEGILLGIAFLLSMTIFNLYKNEVKKHKEQLEKIKVEKKAVAERLFASDRYIGEINVQIREFMNIFDHIKHYPESQADLKKTFRYFGERILTIINSNWVLIRIIQSNTQKTICEHFGTKAGFSCDYPHVSNKMVLEQQSASPFTSVISSPQNLNISVFSVMPVNNISNDQRVFLQAIVNEITKLFIIVNYSHDRKEK